MEHWCYIVTLYTIINYFIWDSIIIFFTITKHLKKNYTKKIYTKKKILQKKNLHIFLFVNFFLENFLQKKYTIFFSFYPKKMQKRTKFC